MAGAGMFGGKGVHGRKACMAGRHAWQGACMVRNVHDGGHAWQVMCMGGGVCMAGGMYGMVGVCVVGGVCRRDPTSYWNAFLLEPT